MTIQPGTYRIKNVKSGTYFDASERESGVIHGWDSRPDQNNQKWEVEKTGEGYTIQNVKTGKYVHVRDDDNGTKVSASDSPSHWDIREEEGAFAIYLHGRRGVIDLDQGKDENGTKISLWNWTGARQQLWKFESGGGQGGGAYSSGVQPAQRPHDIQQNIGGGGYTGDVPPGTYVLKNVKGGSVADLAGGGSNDGAPVIGWGYGGGPNQKWNLEPGQRGYRFRNTQSGTYLGYPRGEQPQTGTAVSGNSNPVEFEVRDTGNGYQIIAAGTNLVLDLASGDSFDGNKIYLWENNQQDNQKWRFERA